ncbi:metalloregulator ArsR/SmtB family transcription factor [Ferrimonas sediminicola]|uniref:Metalloregulator ArsR/SmtB family transcription factor n=1 Tax=Ferrimonas sediminicola TaxID=2569538 RepID=A0A4U1BFN6_9GAMM|nr:metalloregulator ArsR/SmtB family transcription factor [Ferrimonas sediminicola]TKB49230.1 metalloregulator ArsR/SmtB family transcription factor [Ferrimonas sediminicola]
MRDPVSLLKGLADATRLKIMLLISREGELCVCELSAALDESQPKISRHLARLRSEGLLKDVRRGQWVFYRLAELPDWTLDTLDGLNRQRPDVIDADITRLAAMGDRPDRKALCCD